MGGVGGGLGLPGGAVVALVGGVPTVVVVVVVLEVTGGELAGEVVSGVAARAGAADADGEVVVVVDGAGCVVGGAASGPPVTGSCPPSVGGDVVGAGTRPADTRLGTVVVAPAPAVAVCDACCVGRVK
ncbi:MAG: hypothetical protein JOZ99_06675 [Actinobacteria bacterium]|nr:hypothetical protein [Actinomycetota bacterium]